MTTQRLLPGLGLGGYAPRGEGEWDTWMNANLRILSAVTQLAVDDIAALPSSPADGLIYIVVGGVNSNKIAVRDNGAWAYLTPNVGFTAVIKSQKNRILQWDGAQWTVPNGDFTESYVDHGVILTGTVTLDRRLGSAKRVTVGGACTIAFANWPQSGVAADLFLELVNGGSAGLVWPDVQWIRADGQFQSTPTRSPRTTGVDYMLFWTRDGGATVYGKFT